MYVVYFYMYYIRNYACDICVIYAFCVHVSRVCCMYAVYIYIYVLYVYDYVHDVYV